MRFLLPLFLLILLAGCARPPSDQSANPLAQSGAVATGAIKVGMIPYGKIGETTLSGYIAIPDPPATRGPAVLLIHQWWGLDDDMRQKAQDFAKKGYVALAVDLYDGKSTKDQKEAGVLAASVRGNMDRAFQNLNQAAAYVRGLPNVDSGRVASVGWCFGGGWAYQMAKNDLGMRASVMYYGQFDPHDDFMHMRASILGHFGEKDTSISLDTVHEFQAKLQTANGENEVYIYPNVGHGFANANNPTYDKEAADLAWERTLAFLGKVLK